MKSITLVLSFIFLVSCNTKEEGTLTDQERANLQQRFNAKCLTDSASSFNSIKELSDRQFTPSESVYFKRGQRWSWEKKNGTTVIESETVTVWKVGTDVVYFIITKKDANGATSYDFLKIDSTMNFEMIETILAQKCKNDKKFTVSNSTGSATLVKETDSLVSTDRYDRLTITGNFNFSYLAYFGAFDETRVTKQVNAEGTTHSDSTTTTLITTLQRLGDLAETDMQPAYTSYTPSLTRFCTITYTAGSPNVYGYPYARTCDSNPASTTLQGWTNPGSDL